MFQRLRQRLLMWNEKRSVRAAIKLAVTAVYSESPNMSSVVQSISRNESGIELARAYIAVQVAAGLSEPLADADIDHAIEELRISQEQLGQPAFERHLERHRELAEQCWSRKRNTILDGKRAFREDEWSYAGVLFAMEDAKKGPLSTSERKQVRKLTDDAAEAERKLAEYASSRTSPGSTECLEREIADVRRQLADLERFNSPEVLYTRAMMFFDGDDCPQDYVQAAQLCMTAAKQGLAMAQHALALMYENGHGVTQDYSEAAKWYGMAAKQGHGGSQNNLGALFETGQGVAQDHRRALELYGAAADNGDETARENYRRLKSRLERLSTRQRHTDIVSAFSEIVAAHEPLIGDCSSLPYPKRTILYAIRWLMEDLASTREAATDQTLIDSCNKLDRTLGYLFTHLADKWHEIEPGDKDAIAELNKCGSFPEWGLPLKRKYVNEDAASKECLDVTIEVMEDTVRREKR